MRGLVDQRQRQVEAALHAARVAADAAVGGLGEADALQQRVAAALDLARRAGRAGRPGASCARAR